jgi:hypothetical protein
MEGLENVPGARGSMISAVCPPAETLQRARRPPSLLGEVETCRVPKTSAAGSQNDR